MASQLSMPQLAGWMAFMAQEPRGDRRADDRIALLTAFVRGIVGDSGNDDPDKFRLKYRPPEPEITDPAIAALVENFLTPMPLIGFAS